jgi:distribution and morphology protein 34
MSFLFSWNFFDKELLYERTRKVLKETMNKTKKPPIIVGDMDVESFDFGTVPPRLEILEIGDIGIDRFRGIFKVDYEGDASLTLRTRIEVSGLIVLWLLNRTNVAGKWFKHVASKRALQLCDAQDTSCIEVIRAAPAAQDFPYQTVRNHRNSVLQGSGLDVSISK